MQILRTPVLPQVQQSFSQARVEAPGAELDTYQPSQASDHAPTYKMVPGWGAKTQMPADGLAVPKPPPGAAWMRPAKAAEPEPGIVDQICGKVGSALSSASAVVRNLAQLAKQFPALRGTCKVFEALQSGGSAALKMLSAGNWAEGLSEFTKLAKSLAEGVKDLAQNPAFKSALSSLKLVTRAVPLLGMLTSGMDVKEDVEQAGKYAKQKNQVGALVFSTKAALDTLSGCFNLAVSCAVAPAPPAAVFAEIGIALCCGTGALLGSLVN